jgi:hypothetical protein
MRVIGIAAVILALSASAGAQGSKAPASPVEVRTWVSKTAVWVGDRVTYVVELRRAPNVEVFLDDLAPERLRLEGLEILETATERDSSQPQVVIDRMRYTLTTYNVEAPALTVAAIPVRYSVRTVGQKPGDALPAGEITVPPLQLSLRSTIPVSGAPIEIRDQRAVQPLLRRLTLARPVGWTLIALAISPVLLLGVQLVRRIRAARKRRPARPPLRRRRAALEEIRDSAVEAPADRRAAYTRLDAWIREHLHLPGGQPAAAMTPGELAKALAAGKPAEWVDEMERVLMECERAKYAPDLPPDDRWPAVVDETARLTLARKLS